MVESTQVSRRARERAEKAGVSLAGRAEDRRKIIHQGELRTKPTGMNVRFLDPSPHHLLGHL